MVEAYRRLAARCDYPLHLGVTEAGPAFQGTVKSAVAFGALLSQGIGDTIRVSLSAPPAEEVKVGLQVNGPGEAREADLGVASGNGKGQIFVKGEVIKTVSESKIVETLIEEAMKIAEQMEQDGASGEPAVTVS